MAEINAVFSETQVVYAQFPGSAPPDARQIPPGGSIGQPLQKKSSADYDVEWGTGGGGSSVTIVTTVSSASTDEEVPSAKCLFTLAGDVESALSSITTVLEGL